MKWKETFKAPSVTVEGNRFTILPASDVQDIIEGEVVSEAPPRQGLTRRPLNEPPPAPKVGYIPRHSWGA